MSFKLISNSMPEGSTIYVYGGLSSRIVNSISVGDLIFRKQTITGIWITDYIKRFSPSDMYLMFQTIQKGLKTIYKTETKEFDACDFEKAIDHTNNNASVSKSLFKF